MVQTRGRNLGEVVLCDPRVPVVRQDGRGGIWTESLGEGEFIDDSVVVRRFEDGRSDPWFEHKPATEVDAVDLVVVVVEIDVSASQLAGTVSSDSDSEEQLDYLQRRGAIHTGHKGEDSSTGNRSKKHVGQ